MIRLVDLTKADEPLLFSWRAEPEVDRWMSDVELLDADAHAVWFNKLLSENDKRGWKICQDGTPVGLLTLGNLSSHHRRAEWNWFLGSPQARGRGAGRAAQALGLDRAFRELCIDKISSEVMADNDAALKAQAATGFRREGYLRGQVLKNGIRRDVVMLAISAEEWSDIRLEKLSELSAGHLI